MVKSKKKKSGGITIDKTKLPREIRQRLKFEEQQKSKKIKKTKKKKKKNVVKAI